MTLIKKIFNNNIVLAVDADGEEVVVTGAGVGYLTGRGQEVDEARIERTYRLTGLTRTGAFRVLLEIPFPILRTVTRSAELLRTVHGVTLTPAAEVALADHLAQAIARLSTGQGIYNPMLWETKATYPHEFAMALEMLEVVHQELGTRLPLDEAAFITLHLANSGVVGDPREALTLGAALHEVVAITEEALGFELDPGSPVTGRFLTHVKFVIQRVTQHQSYGGTFETMLHALKAERTVAFAAAVRIGEFLRSRFGTHLSEDEHLYLMLHLCRLQDEVAVGGRTPATESEGTP